MIEDPPRLRLGDTGRRPSPGQLDALRDAATGHVVDALGGAGAMDFRIKPILGLPHGVCGSALVCDNGPADNFGLLSALEHLRPGDVIVAATGGYTGCAVTGDLLLGVARNLGAIGLVTDGCVRDLPGLRSVGLPCFAAGVTPNSPARSGPGTVGVPVVVGGVPVATGDIVIADEDGVVIVPFDRIDDCIVSLARVRKAEAELEARVRAGATRIG